MTPAAAGVVFGDRLPIAERFVDHLCESGLERGLLGPREVPRIWSRHVLNCAVMGELVAQDATVLDIGSGAGLPGLALAIARPDLKVTLVEPFERRATWLTEVATELCVPVRVVRARAEQLAGREQADVVTARAVAPLDKLAGWGLPLVSDGGVLLAIKGKSAEREVHAAQPVLRRLGATGAEIVPCGLGVLEAPTTVVRVRVTRGASGPGARPGRRPSRASGRRGRR